MSMNFFNEILKMLGKRVNYDAVVNYAGNSFAKDAWKMIQDANPLTKPRKNAALMDMFASLAVNMSDEKSVAAKEQIKKEADWAEGLL